jgi:hypothetical protein
MMPYDGMTINDSMSYEEAEAIHGRRARFTEWDPMYALTVRPPRKDEVLNDADRVPDSKETDHDESSDET